MKGRRGQVGQGREERGLESQAGRRDKHSQEAASRAPSCLLLLLLPTDFIYFT